MIIDTEEKDCLEMTRKEWLMSYHDDILDGRKAEELTDYEKGICFGLRWAYLLYEGNKKGEYWKDGKWCV